jgi:hypothetical protein
LVHFELAFKNCLRQVFNSILLPGQNIQFTSNCPSTQLFYSPTEWYCHPYKKSADNRYLGHFCTLIFYVFSLLRALYYFNCYCSEVNFEIGVSPLALLLLNSILLILFFWVQFVINRIFLNLVSGYSLHFFHIALSWKVVCYFW